MKKPDRRGHIVRTIVLTLLLALLCIGAAELAASRYFAPEFYQQVTAPVRHAATVAAQAVQRGWNSAVQLGQEICGQAVELGQEVCNQAVLLWAELTAPQEELEEHQLASDPALSSNIPISDPAITELVDEDGRQILTGGTIRIMYFNQGDETWADQPYGTDTIGGYGCGPTAMAMVVSSMTDTATDPAAMADWAVTHGYWARRSGSYHSIVMGIAEDFGLHAEPFTSRTPEELRRALMSGQIMVALMSAGHFTQRGHFILLRGVTLTGDILVADPNSPERSLMVWDPQLILDELSSSSDSGAPLWALSTP